MKKLTKSELARISVTKFDDNHDLPPGEFKLIIEDCFYKPRKNYGKSSDDPRKKNRKTL